MAARRFYKDQGWRAGDYDVLAPAAAAGLAPAPFWLSLAEAKAQAPPAIAALVARGVVFPNSAKARYVQFKKLKVGEGGLDGLPANPTTFYKHQGWRAGDYSLLAPPPEQ